jgi:hypothetical protein
MPDGYGHSPLWRSDTGGSSRLKSVLRFWGRLVLLGCLLSAPGCERTPPSESAFEKLLNTIHEFDEPDRIVAPIHEVTSDGNAYLFAELPPESPPDPTYEATLALCEAFDPGPETRDDTQDSVSQQVDRYLALVSEKSAIRFVLQETSTTVRELRATWFGQGRGFEHVFCGEARSDGKVGGYHWWYKFYREERAGRVDYLYSLEGTTDSRIATIRFTWDPDGPGTRFRPFLKPIGGFTVGDSPAALLALGHLAVQLKLDRNQDAGADFVANINGAPYRWVLVLDRRTGSLVSLYPLANGR